MNSVRNTQHPRDEIMQTMDRIYRYRMTTTSGGNLSIRGVEGDIWISPARIDKGNLTRDDIVCVHADGTADGLHPPSSEFPFHKAIYDAQLCDFVRRGCRQRLLISTEGSFSARVSGDSFLITPTQKDRERLQADDFVLVRGDKRESGKLASRAARAHQAIYEKHPHVKSIVFAHPVNATAFSVTETALFSDVQ